MKYGDWLKHPDKYEDQLIKLLTTNTYDVKLGFLRLSQEELLSLVTRKKFEWEPREFAYREISGYEIETYFKYLNNEDDNVYNFVLSTGINFLIRYERNFWSINELVSNQLTNILTKINSFAETINIIVPNDILNKKITQKFDHYSIMGSNLENTLVLANRILEVLDRGILLVIGNGGTYSGLNLFEILSKEGDFIFAPVCFSFISGPDQNLYVPEFTKQVLKENLPIILYQEDTKYGDTFVKLEEKLQINNLCYRATGVSLKSNLSREKPIHFEGNPQEYTNPSILTCYLT